MTASGRQSALLDRLEPSSRARLEPYLVPVSIGTGEALSDPCKPVEFVYFLKSGLASLTCGDAEHGAAVALIGPENFTGHGLLLGRKQSTCGTIVQIPGEAWRIQANILLRLADEDPALRLTLLNAVDDLFQQIAEAALANAQLTVEARLARLVLMVGERMSEPLLRLTHDRIARMLGCRRAGITMGMHLLEGEKAIRATRGCILVRDEERLRQIARNMRNSPSPAANLSQSPPAPAPARARSC
jgi:CRP-like cAMP-binding protein